jgi:hypothetical protein
VRSWAHFILHKVKSVLQFAVECSMIKCLSHELISVDKLLPCKCKTRSLEASFFETFETRSCGEILKIKGIKVFWVHMACTSSCDWIFLYIRKGVMYSYKPPAQNNQISIWDGEVL